MRRALADLESSTAAGTGGAAGLRRLRLEAFSHKARPFAVGMVLHGLAVALLWAGARYRSAGTSAAVALALGSVCFAGGLALHVVLAARPPFATLAGTFVFVAWVLSAAGLAGYGARGRRLALGLGGGAGLALAAVGRGLAASADELAALPAALDANGWLLAHVGVICLGYAASLAASVLAHLWLLRRCFRGEDIVALGRLYAALRAALLAALVLTAAGTLFGALWADLAWGRPWGWDPKENGALLLILWIAAVLHAARSGIVRERGTAAGAAALVLAVIFSWLAVNLMGKGLHTWSFVSGWGLLVVAAVGLEIVFLGAVALVLLLRPTRRGPTEQVWQRPRE